MSEKSLAIFVSMFKSSVMTGKATAPPPSLVIPKKFYSLTHLTTAIPATVAPKIIVKGISKCVE